MKKLQKLTLKEMSSELNVISKSEMPLVVGGADYQSVINYCMQKLQDDINVGIDGARDLYNSLCSAVQSNSNLIYSVMEEFGTYLIDKCGGGQTPYGAPFIFIDNPDLFDSGSIPPSNYILQLCTGGGGGGFDSSYRIWTWKEPSGGTVKEEM